jgi:hypothetical protein
MLEGLVGLRPEHDQATVEEERRDCVDACRMRLRGCLRNLRSVELSPDRFVSSFETELRCETAENVRVTDVRCVFPVGQHESVVHDGMLPLGPCELRETESRAGVRHDVGWRIVDEAFAREPALNVLVESVAVAAQKLRPWDALRRVLGVKVERQPLDLGAEPALEPLGRPLADATERSDVVGPDQDLVHCA